MLLNSENIKSKRYLTLKPTFLSESPGGVEEYMRNFTDCIPGEITILAFPEKQNFNLWGRIKFLFRAVALNRKQKFDLVICGHLHLGYVALLLKKLFHINYLLILHGTELIRLGLIESPKKYKNIIENSRIILANSNFTKSETIKRFPVAKKIKVVPPILNEKFLNDQRIDPNFKERMGFADKKIILTVGRMTLEEGHKGHDLLLMALDKVFNKHPDAVCVIVGEGDGRARLMEFAAALKLENRVVFHSCDCTNIHNYYHYCDLFIMPSRFEKTTGNCEGFGIVFMEAAFFAKPCIGGRSGGIPDVIVDGQTGILVDPTDPNDIARAINKLLDDPEYARKLGQAAQLRVNEEFSRKKILPMIVEILNESSNS